jgi:hypothetical protein
MLEICAKIKKPGLSSSRTDSDDLRIVRALKYSESEKELG